MQFWLQTIGVFVLADTGTILGLLTKRLKKRLWLLGYFVPLILIVLIALPRHLYWLVFYPPFSWLNAGRREYVVFAFAIPMLFSTLIPHIESLRLKILVSILVAVACTFFFIVPFVSPILVRKELRNLEPGAFYNGVYIQAADYTCGPAAAVNALFQLGIEPDERELAINAYTSPHTGTSDDLLAKAIEKLYGSQGVIYKYRKFNAVGDTKENCPVIVVTRFSFLVDHYVAVIKVTDDKVIIANPATGREALTYEEFQKKWRSVGIVLKKR
jgi:predicted double-glycine peptidase